MWNLARSVQVARRTGIVPEVVLRSEAPPRTWRDEDLPSSVLQARMLLGSRKKLPSEALKVGLPPEWRTRVERPELLSLMGKSSLAGTGEPALYYTLVFPGLERGSEPCKAYRQDLRQRVDAIYVNLGTIHGSPYVWA